MERYPTADLLKLLANILTHIAHANDASPAPVPNVPVPVPAAPPVALTSAARTVLVPSAAAAVPLTFHARNVPTISLESYLLRILKYCPTSNFVFLSLLVYFDRMAALSLASAGPAHPARRLFHVDSYNVHRLVIAGVTVASKFFSDVFYTNSRYAKVGGLPLPELNQLELQFLLLNDFRLVISPQQMLIYSQHLVAFSLQHPPPSIASLDFSLLAAAFPPAAVPPPPPPTPVVVLPTTSTTTTPAPSSSSSSPLLPPSSPPLRPSSSPSPSPSNSSNSSLRSSPSASPRPPRMILTNGHHSRPRYSSHPSLLDVPRPDSDHDNDDDDDSDDSDKGDAETLTSTSTDDDSEPTIRGPRTVVGCEGDKSP